MELPKIPNNEKERLNILKSYSLLDSLPEKEYDDITFLAASICETPVSYISLIDERRQWFKSKFGLDISHTPREISFCAHAIANNDQVMIVNDARNDHRFFDNPLVIGDPHIIFYVSIPLLSKEGYPLGTLCVVDKKPRMLNEKQLNALKILSNQVVELFEARKNNIKLQKLNAVLEKNNMSLNNFARVAAHDLKSPLNNIVQLTQMLKKDLENVLEKDSLQLLDLIESSSAKLRRLIDGILKFSQISDIKVLNKTDINVFETVNSIISQFFTVDNHVEFDVRIPENLSVFTNKTALDQIFLNLISNAIKYNDKKTIHIKIDAVVQDDSIEFTVTDNGIGIKQNEIEKIFDIYETTSNLDKYGEKGTGIGLATVKLLVEALGGEIKVKSEYTKGTSFEFSIKN